MEHDQVARSGSRPVRGGGMSLAGPAASAEAVAVGSTPDVLAQITAPAVHLALWQRPLPAALAPLVGQARERVDDIDRPVAVAALAAQVPALLAAAGYAPAPTAAAELIMLAERFARIMACAALRLRLEVIAGDGCRRFHADYVTARLLMTLAGAETQWRPAGCDAAPASLAPGSVALFKGRLWAPEPAILHRSPPIAGSGSDRLLLALDPLSLAAS